MENVRSFKLKNNGDFVARIQVLKLLGDKWHNVAPTSGYRDICKHAERTLICKVLLDFQLEKMLN